MSKTTSESSAMRGYSKGYMTGICGGISDVCPPKIKKVPWTKGRSKGLAVRKMHAEKLRQKSWFSTTQTSKEVG